MTVADHDGVPVYNRGRALLPLFSLIYIETVPDFGATNSLGVAATFRVHFEADILPLEIVVKQMLLMVALTMLFVFVGKLGGVNGVRLAG